MLPTDALVTGGVTLFGLAILAAGLSIARIGTSRLRIARELRETGPMSLGDVAGASGLVGFAGTARAGDEGTLEAPQSGTNCLAYAVQSRARDGTADESTWRVDGRASESLPFVVDDGDDRVAVDPTNAVLSLERWETEGTSWTDRSELPAGVLDRIAVLGLPVPDRDGGRNGDSRPARHRQYRERRLEPGDDVRVFGGSVADSSGRDGDTDAPVTVSGGDWFEISVGEESSVIPDRYRSGSLYLIFGGLITIPGVGFTLAGLVGLVTTLS